MLVLAFNGSPHEKGNTHLLPQVFAPLQEAGITCEEIRGGGTLLAGCKTCGACAGKLDQ